MRKIILSLCFVLFFFVSLPVYAKEVESLTGIAVVEVEILNVRSGPSKEYDKLGTLTKDISVEVKGFVEPDWYLIDFEGEEGYINSEYVIFTPLEENRSYDFFIDKKYLVMVLVVGILIISGILVYTFINMRKEEDEVDIPITDHDDTNMHMGEITYDTYRIDIDPKYFEQTTIIPQPESIHDERRENPWKKDLFGDEKSTEQMIEEQVVRDQITSEADIQMLDSKLELASAQIAALQKEVEELKKQQPDSI